MSLTKRRTTVATTEFKLGWCMGAFGKAKGFHAKHDADGKLVPGTCPGMTSPSSVETKHVSKGGRLYCQCKCHGDNQPEAWPGYAKTDRAVVLDDDDSDTEETPVTEPAAEASDSESGKTVTAQDTVGTETHRYKYPNGEVARMEIPGTNRKGDAVTHINWIAYNLAGTQLGTHWSRGAAKRELSDLS